MRPSGPVAIARSSLPVGIGATVVQPPTDTRDNAPVLSAVPPSWKVTVPVGAAAPGAMSPTVAVKVTFWPNAEGLAEDVTVVVVLTWLTVWTRPAELLSAKLLSPA